eukprot:379152_1
MSTHVEMQGLQANDGGHNPISNDSQAGGRSQNITNENDNTLNDIISKYGLKEYLPILLWLLVIYSFISCTYLLSINSDNKCECTETQIQDTFTTLGYVFRTDYPSISPVIQTTIPSQMPTDLPSLTQSQSPTDYPSNLPSNIPTPSPTINPTSNPSISPTKLPSQNPSKNPSQNPTKTPTLHPTISPSKNATATPTSAPTSNPSSNPTSNPTKHPSISPSSNPTSNPSNPPTKYPSISPSSNPSSPPTRNPSKSPSANPSKIPTKNPSINPSANPSPNPSLGPTFYPTKSPSNIPTISPTHNPTLFPSISPTASIGVVVQMQHIISHTKVTSASSGWTEPSSDYRLSITPKFVDSEIILTYNFYFCVATAGGRFPIFSAAKSMDSGATFQRDTITSTGLTYGTRTPTSGMGVRTLVDYSYTGQLGHFVVYDYPNTTQQIIYTLQVYQSTSAGIGTIRMGYGDYDTEYSPTQPVMLIAMEIKQ